MNRTRVKQLTFSLVLKHSLGQGESLLDPRQLLDEGKWVILNLALLNTEARKLLGRLLTVMVEQAALSRSELRTRERHKSHHLILDEFAEFSAQSDKALRSILDQTRKYGLFLVLAHQIYSPASEKPRAQSRTSR